MAEPRSQAIGLGDGHADTSILEGKALLGGLEWQQLFWGERSRVLPL